MTCSSIPPVAFGNEAVPALRPTVHSATIAAGQSFPLGATVCPGGINFSVFSRRATRIELLLFDSAADAHPTHVVALDPRKHRTYHYWHVFVPGIGAGQLYAYRAFGPFDPKQGLRFDPSKALLDPYGRAVVVPEAYSRHRSSRYGERGTIAMKSAVLDSGTYDWEGDKPLRRNFASTVIYEMHLAGFTRHPSSGVAAELRGTYAGMIEKIPYLRDLGITAVELLPIFQFDGQDCPPGLANYWGYSPVSFFAPHAGYSSRKDALGPADESRDLVGSICGSAGAGDSISHDAAFRGGAVRAPRRPLRVRGKGRGIVAGTAQTQRVTQPISGAQST